MPSQFLISQFLGESTETEPESFRPYVFVITERWAPTSIAMAATGAGNLKCVNLQGDITLSNLPRIREKLRLYFEKTNWLPLFGVIEGFFVVLTATDGVLLDRNCDEVENSRRQGDYWAEEHQHSENAYE